MQKWKFNQIWSIINVIMRIQMSFIYTQNIIRDIFTGKKQVSIAHMETLYQSLNCPHVYYQRGKFKVKVPNLQQGKIKWEIYSNYCLVGRFSV